MKSAIAFMILLSCLFAIGSSNNCHQEKKKSANERQEYLNEHNKIRHQHGLPPFTWDHKLEDFAKNYLRKLYVNCKMEHSTGPYGENLAGGFVKWKPGKAVEAWASEAQYYNANDNSCQPGKGCLHYTQIVWRDTHRIGCARIKCKNSDSTLIACEYDPHGNVVGQRPFDQHHKHHY